jgi:signal transduction histidine kinase
VLALSEVFAFAGERNAALHGKVTASSSFDLPDAWSSSYLTDGFSLFVPINRKLRDPTQCFRGFGDEVQLEMDLGKERRIDEFRLWPVVYSLHHNFPPMSGIGFPQSFRVELASSPDFSETRVLHEDWQVTQQAGGGPWMRRSNPVSGRFVRITLRDGIRDVRRKDHAEISLGEIELLEDGKVVSYNIPFCTPKDQTKTIGLSLLTDKLVSEGEILPLRGWLSQFHQQVALTEELKVLWPAATDARIRDEKRTIAVLLIAIGLIVALLQLVWLVRVVAHRRWARMRERIACDLHDEIGANVSSIAHTAELLKESIREPSETQSRLMLNLIESAHLTTKETKHFIRFIENEEQDRDLTEQFVQVSNRILGTIPVNFSLENTRSFNALDPSTKWNVLLFFKEALNNIIKHSGANAVEIRTWRTGLGQFLEIADNGRGIPKGSTICRHLESRAKVLGGQLEILSRPAEGTRVILKFNRNSKS